NNSAAHELQASMAKPRAAKQAWPIGWLVAVVATRRVSAAPDEVWIECSLLKTSTLIIPRVAQEVRQKERHLGIAEKNALPQGSRFAFTNARRVRNFQYTLALAQASPHS